MVDLSNFAARYKRPDDPEKLTALEGVKQLRELIAAQGGRISDFLSCTKSGM